MAYKAKDGKILPTVMQGRKYDESLAEKSKSETENAPGGPEHIENVRAHGVVHKSVIEFEGNGRWRHTATHADGVESTSVHPQWHRAHDVQAMYFDPDGKPGALETHQKSRSHPVGPKESERLDKEDGRVQDDAEV